MTLTIKIMFDGELYGHVSTALVASKSSFLPVAVFLLITIGGDIRIIGSKNDVMRHIFAAWPDAYNVRLGGEKREPGVQGTAILLAFARLEMLALNYLFSGSISNGELRILSFF